jgi:hypothetical protein
MGNGANETGDEMAGMYFKVSGDPVGRLGTLLWRKLWKPPSDHL